MEKDLRFGRMEAANTVFRVGRSRGRTVPIPESVMRVPGYPDKLVIYRIQASKYWQVRCWIRGRMRKRSARTTSLPAANALARIIYEQWLCDSAVCQHTSSDPPAIHKAAATGLGVSPVRNSASKFSAVASQLLLHETARVQRGDFSRGSLQILHNRLGRHLLPRLGEIECNEVNFQKLQNLVMELSAEHSSTTIHQYLVVVRKVLQHAVKTGLLEMLPAFPHVRVKARSRGAFTPTEYWQIIRCARKLRNQPSPLDSKFIRTNFAVRLKEQCLPPDLAWAIGFMVNSFIRPSDLRTLKHRHIEIVRGENTYLRMNLPETKRHDSPIVTLYPAVRIYQQILKSQRAQGRGGPEDYLFLPHLRDRHYALAVLGFHLNWVLAETNLKHGPHGQARSLYSFRHSAITFRLLYGRGIDLLTLARNARTSIEVINHYYASSITAEQNIAMLQSRRTRNPPSRV